MEGRRDRTYYHHQHNNMYELYGNVSHTALSALPRVGGGGGGGSHRTHYNNYYSQNGRGDSAENTTITSTTWENSCHHNGHSGGGGGGVTDWFLFGETRSRSAASATSFTSPAVVWSVVVKVFWEYVRILRWGLRSSLRNLYNMNRQKSTSLGALVLQTSVLALTIRYSRTETVTGPRYLTSTAVVTSELLKLVACFYMLLYSTNGQKGRGTVWDDLFNLKEAVKTTVPAGLYTLQNNLQFIAVSYLDAATFQVTYQLKILTTAVFSVLFLKRQLDSLRWSALVMLTAGVALVQLPDSSASGESRNGGGDTTLVGLTAVLVMSLSSGFAGVYFEKILKSSTQSIWAKNVQMAFVSVLLGLMGVMVGDGARVAEHGFFQGYNTLTLIIVIQQAVLGLIISLVMKYADNILKGFASAISIVLTSFISFLLLNDLQPSCSFLVGSVIVMGSVLLYNVDREAQKYTTHTV